MKIFGLVFGALTILWIFYIWLGSTAQVRVYRTCYPAEVTAQMMSHVVSRWDAGAGQTIDQVGAKAVNWCQYGMYRSIYGERQLMTFESAESANHK